MEITLDSVEPYEIEHVTELTGTTSAPIYFSGNCNNCSYAKNPDGCEYISDELLPIQYLDLQFIIPPNANDRDTLIHTIVVEIINVTYKISGVTQKIHF